MVRTLLVRALIARIKDLPRVTAQRVLQRVPASEREQLVAPGFHEWWPMETYVTLLKGLRAELGTEEYQRFIAAVWLSFGSLPSVKIIFSNATSPARDAPFITVRLLVMALRTLFKNTGSMTLEPLPDPNEAYLILDGYPPHLDQHDGVGASLTSYICRLIEQLSGRASTTTVVERDPQRGYTKFHIRLA